MVSYFGDSTLQVANQWDSYETYLASSSVIPKVCAVCRRYVFPCACKNDEAKSAVRTCLRRGGQLLKAHRPS